MTISLLKLFDFIKPDLKVVNINSRIETELNLCKIVRYGKFKGRVNLTEPDQIMQVSLGKISQFNPVQKHRHLPIERSTTGTSEGWLVLKGCFEVEIFDVDYSSVGKFNLKKLDMILTFNSGHSLHATNDNSIICEFKNGPFKGSDSDKIYF